jgi:6-phosphogluconolactonase (cycloisomerase 2 family)
MVKNLKDDLTTSYLTYAPDGTLLQSRTLTTGSDLFLSSGIKEEVNVLLQDNLYALEEVEQSGYLSFDSTLQDFNGRSFESDGSIKIENPDGVAGNTKFSVVPNTTIQRYAVSLDSSSPMEGSTLNFAGGRKMSLSVMPELDADGNALGANIAVNSIFELNLDTINVSSNTLDVEGSPIKKMGDVSINIPDDSGVTGTFIYPSLIMDEYGKTTGAESHTEREPKISAGKNLVASPDVITKEGNISLVASPLKSIRSIDSNAQLYSMDSVIACDSSRAPIKIIPPDSPEIGQTYTIIDNAGMAGKNNISVFPDESDTVPKYSISRSFRGDYPPTGMVIDKANNWLYVTNCNNDTFNNVAKGDISFIRNNNPMMNYPFSRPCILPDNKWLFVATIHDRDGYILVMRGADIGSLSGASVLSQDNGCIDLKSANKSKIVYILKKDSLYIHSIDKYIYTEVVAFKTAASGITLDREDNWLYVSFENGDIEVYDINTPEKPIFTRTLNFDLVAPQGMCVDNNNNFIYVANKLNITVLSGADTGNPAYSFKFSKGSYVDVCIDNTNTWLYSLYNNNDERYYTIFAYNLKTKDNQFIIDKNYGSINITFDGQKWLKWV